MKNNKRKIVASLTYGKGMSVVALILFTVLLFSGAGIIYLGVNAEGADKWVYLISGLLIVIAMIYCLFTGIQMNIRIKLFQKDGVELTAISSIPENGVTCDQYDCKIKIRVEFFYQGEKHVQISGEKWPYVKIISGLEGLGYHKAFKNYEGREIKILYSPKYDEVLILAD